MNANKRRYGSMIGAAVGDAIGVTYEFSPAFLVPKPPYEMIGGGPFGLVAGGASDDTDLFYAVLAAYADRNEFDSDEMVRLMLQWYDWGPPDIGGGTAIALMCWKGGFEPLPDESMQGNGGLMRAAAHALANDSLEATQQFAAQDTRLTHNSDLAADCSALIAGIAWGLIGGRDPEYAYQLSLQSYDYAEPHLEFLRPYERLPNDMSGHCLHTLRLALWGLLRADSYESSIETIVQAGGDTDTNACVAGALLGARFGRRGIPDRWVNSLHPDNKKRLDREFVRLLPFYEELPDVAALNHRAASASTPSATESGRLAQQSSTREERVMDDKPEWVASARVLLKAAAFAADKHRMQRRKDIERSPYINHPLALADILCSEGGVADATVLVAALLHDTVEDTETTLEELEREFGEDVAAIVAEVTDDKSLPKQERKRLQVVEAASKSEGAKLVKIADKISNLRDISATPPADWQLERRLEYFRWAKQVVDGLRGVNARLEAAFDTAYEEGVRSEIQGGAD